MMRRVRRDEHRVAWSEALSLVAENESAGTLYAKVDFILGVRLLWVVAHWSVKSHRHRAIVETFSEAKAARRQLG